MSIWRVLGVGLPAVFVAACAVDTTFPDGIQLTCATSAECPDGWECGLAGQCRSPDAPPDDAEKLVEAKVKTCGMIWDKAQGCRADTLRVLGPTADAEFDRGREDFVTLCTDQLMDGATPADLPRLQMAQQFMPALSCANFAPSLCDIFIPDHGYSDTNCPPPS